MTAPEEARKMLLMVATALGQDLLEEVAFVGGCTTSLLVTDEFSLEAARFTDDVDVIVDIVGQLEWYKFQSILRNKGLRYTQLTNLHISPPLQESPTCLPATSRQR